MISIIVCTKTCELSHRLSSNIHNTIGVDYELVLIDNSRNQYSIFSAYNSGVKKTHGEILCFIHEDISFLSLNWGENLIKHFSNRENGLVGVFGGHFLPDFVCHIGDSELLVSNYDYIDSDGNRYEFRTEEEFDTSGEAEVVAVDGLFFAIRASLFNKITFDESYTGFHYYDMDICMQVWREGLKCIVVNDILIEHTSAGFINRFFVDNSYHFYQKWKNCLPMIKGCQCDDSILSMSSALCRYKAYSRELQLENDSLKSTKWYYLYLLFKTISSWFLSKKQSCFKWIKHILSLCRIMIF